MHFLVDIGFLNVSLWDVLDWLIVSFLIYRIYKLLRGSIAFNIFFGLVMLYAIWWLVNALNMELLSTILSQFVSVGVIMLIVIFQPEIRKFLLELGQSALGNRLDFLRKWLNLPASELTSKTGIRMKMIRTIHRLRDNGRDAVFVLDSGADDNFAVTSGLTLDTEFNRPLLESIFHPDSELKQGAAVISEKKLKAVGVRFPHSENDKLPAAAGLKHRLGLGATEMADVGAIIVSGSDGTVSTAYKGYLAYDVSDDELERFIISHT